MTTEKVDTFNYIVNPFDDDFTGRLSWAVLGKHVLACAECHAGARGFDSLERDGKKYLWVLSRMIFEIDVWPRLGDKYSISTWVRRYYRYFTDRCFDIRDEQGNVIGRVSTIWAMIDAETRQPQNLTDLFGQTFDPYIEEERPCDVGHVSKIRVNQEQPIYERKPYYSDIDQNDHVNSIKYIEFLLDAFPKSNFENNEVSRLEIAYNSESRYGDTLSFYIGLAADSPEDTFHVVVKKVGADTEQVVCHSSITFRSLIPERATPKIEI